MTKQYDDQAVWVNIDETTLSDTERRLYASVKAAWRAAKEAKATFEDAMQANITEEGKRMIFGYRFGKLSVAIVEGEAKSERKPAKGALNLSAYLAMQAASGRAS